MLWAEDHRTRRRRRRPLALWWCCCGLCYLLFILLATGGITVSYVLGATTTVPTTLSTTVPTTLSTTVPTTLTTTVTPTTLTTTVTPTTLTTTVTPTTLTTTVTPTTLTTTVTTVTSTTTAATTTSTTTTVATTTAPSSFSLSCPANVTADLELTQLTNYTITGTGCGGSTVVVNATQSITLYYTRDVVDTQQVYVPAVVTNATYMTNVTAVSVHVYPPITLPPLQTSEQSRRNFGQGMTGFSTATGPFADVPASTVPYEVYGPLDMNGNGSWILQGLSSSATFTLYVSNATSSLTIAGSSIFPAACGTGNASFPIDIKFASPSFYIATLYGTSLCVATSSGPNPVTATWTVTQYANVTAYTHGFSFAVWNGYQTACWDQVCHVIDPVGAQLVQFNVSSVGGPAYAVPQGNFSDSVAPCGAFGLLNGTTVVLQTCQTVNFTSGTVALNVSTISVPINASPGVLFSTYIRMTHGRNNVFSYAYASNLTTLNDANLYIGTFPSQPLAFRLTNSLANTSALLWTWNLVLDCRDTLYFVATGTATDFMINKRSFRLATDPPGTLVQKTQTVSDILVGGIVNTTSSMPVALMDSGPLVTRTWIDSHAALFVPAYNQIEALATRTYVLSEQHAVTYTAVDACNVTQTCNQTVYLTTVAPCVSF